MRKLIILYFIILALLTIFFGCKKEDSKPVNETGVITFYIGNTNSTGGVWNLILDGKDAGQLKKASQMPVCGDTDFIVRTLTTGKHTYDVKSMSGYAWGHVTEFTVNPGCVSLKVK